MPPALRYIRILMNKVRIIITVFFVLLTIFLFPGCGKEPVSIESITLSQDVDESYAPIDPNEVFKPGTSTVYVSVKINNMTPEDKLTAAWYYMETGEELNTTDYTPESTGSGYIGFSIKSADSFPSGNYSVEIYLNDELYETKSFSVE